MAWICPFSQLAATHNNPLLMCKKQMSADKPYNTIQDQARVMCKYAYYCPNMGRRVCDDKAQRECQLYNNTN